MSSQLSRLSRFLKVLENWIRQYFMTYNLRTWFILTRSKQNWPLKWKQKSHLFLPAPSCRRDRVVWSSPGYLQCKPFVSPHVIFSNLAAVNLQMNRTVKYQGAFSRIVGFAGKHFLFSPPPPSSIFFFFAPSLTITRLETVATQASSPTWRLFHLNG